MKALLPLLLLSSCTLSHEKQPDGSTSTLIAVGGKGAHRQGVGTIWNNEKSFNHFVTVAGTVAAGAIAANVSEAQEVTKQGETAASVKKEAIAAKTKRIEGAQALKAKELEMMEVPAP